MEYDCDVKDYPSYMKRIFNKNVSMNDIYDAFYDRSEDLEREARIVEYY